MRSLFAGERELVSRRNELRSIFMPLSKSRDITFSMEFGKNLALAAHSGKKPPSPHRDWWFSTFASLIIGQYFEFWKPTNGNGVFCLHNAYLNFYRKEKQTRQRIEVLGMHCDSDESLSGNVSVYQREPHLHVSIAESPIPDCHFPLQCGMVGRDLTTLESLDKAIGKFVSLAANEILPRF